MDQEEGFQEPVFTDGDGVLDRILERVRQGDPVDMESLVREFPDHEQELPRLIQLVGFVHGAAQSIHPLHDLEARLAAGERPKLGAYEIRRLLARGGMGVVYEAYESELDRPLAVKLLSGKLNHSVNELERFRREARHASRLTHPHIVPVYAVGDYEGVPYYAMRLIEGRSLSQLAKEERAMGELSAEVFVKRVARWGVQVASALSHAHREGVVHRDVKPSNILIDGSDSAFVTDFGLARNVTDATLTASGDLIGTLRYMSPEQARGALHRQHGHGLRLDPLGRVRRQDV